MTSSRHGFSKVSGREARILSIPRSIGADVQWLIAPCRETLQLTEDISAAPFRVGHQPGNDLLLLSCKGVFVGAPPAQDAFSPLLLSVEGVEHGSRIGNVPLGRKRSCCTIFHGKDADGGRWDW
jgi:hypothetical protein